MPTLDEQIAQSLRDAQRSGELQSAASWGKPLVSWVANTWHRDLQLTTLALDNGYAQTPEELRLAFKALKEAGFVPPEVETMKQIAALREVLAAEPESPQADAMRKRLSELQQHLALRLEKLRVSGSL